jgi:peptidoglycan biosynthesis protein MviN/MurJ (putative lipid II flippase)
LYAFLTRRHGAIVSRDLVSVLARIVAASIAMAFAARRTHDALAAVIGVESFAARALSVLPALAVAACVYCALAWLLRLEDLNDFMGVPKRRRV